MFVVAQRPSAADYACRIAADECPDLDQENQLVTNVNYNGERSFRSAKAARSAEVGCVGGFRIQVIRERPGDPSGQPAGRAATDRRPSSQWISSRELVGKPAPGLRKALFAFVAARDPEAELARACLDAIDELRNEHGPAQADTGIHALVTHARVERY